MHKNGLIASSLMIAALVVASQSLSRPAVAGEGNACAPKQGNPAAAENKSIEVDGIRFEVFVSQEYERVREKDSFVPTDREIQIPQKSSRNVPLGERSNQGGYDRYEYFGVYFQATNCTNQEIQVDRFGSISAHLRTSDGQAVKSVRVPPLKELVNGATAESRIGLVRLKPGESININNTTPLRWDGDSLTVAFGGERFQGLQPGTTYQLQLTYWNDVNNIHQQPKVWSKKVTPPAVTFRLAEPKN
jgi:hypothetical protein